MGHKRSSKKLLTKLPDSITQHYQDLIFHLDAVFGYIWLYAWKARCSNWANWQVLWIFMLCVIRSLYRAVLATVIDMDDIDDGDHALCQTSNNTHSAPPRTLWHQAYTTQRGWGVDPANWVAVSGRSGFTFGASWLSGSMCDVQARDSGFNPWLRWVCSDIELQGKALCSHVHSLDPGVSGYLVGQWRLVCLNSSVRCKMAAGLYAARGVEMAYKWTGPVTRA